MCSQRNEQITFIENETKISHRPADFGVTNKQTVEEEPTGLQNVGLSPVEEVPIGRKLWARSSRCEQNHAVVRFISQRLRTRAASSRTFTSKLGSHV
jgi:hypothetical protein